MCSLHLRGVYSVIPTAFDNTGALDLDAVRFNMQRWNDTAVSGFFLLTLIGESFHLTLEEKLTLIQTVKSEVAPDKHIIVNTGACSTDLTISTTNKAADAGADVAAIMPPYCYQEYIDERELEEHYVQLAERSEIPIILQNIPSFTRLHLSGELIVKLSHHPNILGLGDETGNISLLEHCTNKCSDSFEIMTMDVHTTISALLMGSSAVVTPLATLIPSACGRLYDLSIEGRWEEAAQSLKSLLRLQRQVIDTHGIVGIKAAMDLMGYKGGFPRSPLLPLVPKKKQDIAHILESIGLL